MPVTKQRPVYCLKPEDLPCFWQITEHVFAGHLSKAERADIMMARHGSASVLLAPEMWPEAGLFLSGCEMSEGVALDRFPDAPASLPVYPGIGFLQMVLAGMSLLDGEARLRTSTSSRDRLIRMRRTGMPSLRGMAGHVTDLASDTMEGRYLVSSSICKEMKQRLLCGRKVLISSPENLRDLSRDPVTGKVRIEPKENEWHVLVCDPDDAEAWLEGREIFRSSRRITCPEIMARLLGEGTPVVWGQDDRRALLNFVKQQRGDLPDVHSISCLKETILFILNEEDEDLWGACNMMLVSTQAPASRHQLIARWPNFPSEVMADLFMAGALFRAETIKLKSPAEHETYGRIMGPILSDTELALF